MKSAIFLRMAALLALLEAVGHTFLFVSYVPKHGEEIAVVDAMKRHYFDVGGFSHSYWEMYFGYGLFTTVSCLIEAGILWQLAALLKRGVSGIRAMVAVFFFGEVGYIVLVIKYFFTVPIVSHIIMAALLAGAFIMAKAEADSKLSS